MEAKDNRACSDILDRIEVVSQRAVNLTRQLLTFSKGGDPIKKTASIVEYSKKAYPFSWRDPMSGAIFPWRGTFPRSTSIRTR